MSSIIKKLRRRSSRSTGESTEQDSTVSPRAPSLPHPLPSGTQQPRDDWSLNSHPTTSNPSSDKSASKPIHPNASTPAIGSRNQSLPIREANTKSPNSDKNQLSSPSLGFAEDVAERNIPPKGGRSGDATSLTKDQNGHYAHGLTNNEEYSSASMYQTNLDSGPTSNNKSSRLSNGEIIQGKYVPPSRNDIDATAPRTPLKDPFPSPLMKEDPLYDRSIAIEVASTEWKPRRSSSPKVPRKSVASSAAKQSPPKEDLADSGVSLSTTSAASGTKQHKEPQYAVKDAKEPPSLEGVVDLTSTETVHTHKTVAKPVYHETVIPSVEHVRHEYVQRENHTHSVHHRIQPIKETITLPTKHYAPSGPNGELVEISTRDVPTHNLDRANMVSKKALDMLPDASKGDWDPTKFSSVHREFAPEDLKDNYKSHVDADGVERSRSTWVHPPNFVGASDTSAVQPSLPEQSHNRKRSTDLTGAAAVDPRKSTESARSTTRRRELPGERTESIVASTLGSASIPPRVSSNNAFDERVMRDTSTSPSSSKSRERVGGTRHRATSSQSRAGASSPFDDDSIPPVPNTSSGAAKHARVNKQYPDESSSRKLVHRPSEAQWNEQSHREKQADGVISAARKAAGFA